MVSLLLFDIVIIDDNDLNKDSVDCDYIKFFWLMFRWKKLVIYSYEVIFE